MSETVALKCPLCGSYCGLDETRPCADCLALCNEYIEHAEYGCCELTMRRNTRAGDQQ